MKEKKIINWSAYSSPEERIQALNENPGAIANELLLTRDSIVYRAKDTPIGCFVREYADGRKIIFRVDEQGREIVIQQV
ncbi:hypothetical protein [Xenorhabdus stockiae]|uniref:hypothetical protein n=1 Tax=Xenorhabdus stockiae TaxID=351614 RepID=UPI00406466C5